MQSSPTFTWLSMDKQSIFYTNNYGFSHFQTPKNEIDDTELSIEPTIRKIPSQITVILSPFCKPSVWWQTLVEDRGNGVVPIFFHRGRLFCGPLLHRQSSVCPTCVSLRLAQGFPHRDVLLSVMANSVTSTYLTVLDDMCQIALPLINRYEHQLRIGQMISCNINASDDSVNFHQIVALPGSHPTHHIQSGYASVFIGSEKAYNIMFRDSQFRTPNFIDKYVGPVLLTLPANTFPGEPENLRGYVTTVGHLGKYTSWAPDVTGAGMSFGPEAENASIGEAIERYCGNFIPDTLYIQSEHDLRHQVINFLPQSLFRNLSPTQEDYYTLRLSPISDQECVRWVRADSLTEHVDSHLVPAEAAYLNSTRYTGSKAHFPVVLAGVAAHRTRMEAETSALLEIIERDATMRWWYGGVPGKRIVDIHTIESVIEPSQPIEQWCLLLDSEFAYVVAGCLYDRINGTLTVGFAARHKIDIAILKALAEAWQLRRLSLDLLNPNSQLWKDIQHKKFPFPTRGFRADRAYAESFRADFLDMDQLAYNIQFFLDPATHKEALQRLDGECVSYDNLPSLCDDQSTIVRLHCLTRLQSSGFNVFSVDLTTPDMASSGFRVVRLPCPNLVGNAATAFVALAHPRLVQAWMNHNVPKFYPMPHS